MDKNIIKSFAIESRRQLIESVKYQASLIGITTDGINEPISKAEGMETYDYGAGTYSIYDNDIEKRKSLVREIQNKGFENVVEEVAYTWFNRIIAIRFMEVNDYLPSRTRVLSSETKDKIEPDIITEALDLDFDYTNEDKELILKLKDDNKLNDLFIFLFIKQCNKLNEILPGLFEKTDDYMELLLNISFTNNEGIIRKLIDSIPENDFGEQVEIIGWLYQYYNTELKDETFANVKKKIKVPKERIPSITQLFTPNWIVRYMVENSLGRLWLEGHYNSELKSKWAYYVDLEEQDKNVEIQLNEIVKNTKNIRIEDIKVIDPCMGSGHILVYIFDLLMDIYISEGFTEKDAVESILKNNLFGLDIDQRAYQLSYFAIMMKARSYDRKIFFKNIVPLVYPIPESNFVSQKTIDFLISQDSALSEDLTYIMDTFRDAREYGSIIKINNNCNLLGINDLLKNIIDKKFFNSLDLNYQEIEILYLISNVASILSNSYDAVVTNPPYMGSNSMNSQLKKYLQKNYPISKLDLFGVFIERCQHLLKNNGFSGMITPPTFLYIASFEKLRKDILNNHTINNLIQFSRGVFGIDFGSTSFIIRNKHINNYKGSYFRLYERTFQYVKPEDMANIFTNTLMDKDYKFNFSLYDTKEGIQNNSNNTKESIKIYHAKNQEDFLKIPGSPISYWVSNIFIDSFSKYKSLKDYGDAKMGIKTGKNDKYMRMFWEIDYTKLNDYWYLCAKGGSLKKYYGNIEMVINWSEEAKDFYITNKSSSTMGDEFCFKEGITYSSVSSKGTGFRYLPEYALFANMGPSIVNIDDIFYFIGFLNSKVAKLYLDVLNPGLGLFSYHINALPIIMDENNKNLIENLTRENVKISKNNWDSFENSYDFKRHPFLFEKYNTIQLAFENWSNLCNNHVNIIKDNERKLNELFINIYSLNNVLTDNVEDNDITLNLPDINTDVKSFISYAVGCMFGRYSLDNDGIIYAGGNFSLNDYSSFIPDDDNIIPVLDTEYFEDDIVGRFVEFVKICFGEETLEENLEFIAKALNKKGKTSRETIRNYFLKDFFKDHSQIYKKCPIYWQFDSGKQNAFKCLIYMHRYQPDIIARVRTDYLHKTQKAIEQNLVYCDNIISNSTNKSEISKATKDKNKYIKQLDEIKVYDEALRHMANQNIKFDFDEGVKKNHSKFQKVEISMEGEKPKKINLLKNI